MSWLNPNHLFLSIIFNHINANSLNSSDVAFCMQNGILRYFPPAAREIDDEESVRPSVDSALCRNPAPGNRGRSPVRRVQPRPVQHRCVALPDRTDRRGRAQIGRGYTAVDRNRGRSPASPSCRAVAAHPSAGRPSGKRWSSTSASTSTTSSSSIRRRRADYRVSRAWRSISLMAVLNRHGLMFMVDVSTS